MGQPYTNAFRGPMRAEIDRDVYSNALLKNEVARLPQQNKAQDLAIQGTEQNINQNRQVAARQFLGDVFTGIAQSQDPINTGRTILGNSSFQAALRDVGMDPAQFTITDQDTPETLQKQSADLARVFAGGGQQQRVQSTQVLEDGTIAYVTSDGQLVRTGEKARNPLQFSNDVGQGVPGFANRLTGQVAPVSTTGAENQAVADRAAATTRGEAQGGTKPVRLAAAQRRLERVKAASEALGFGGPMVGGVVGMTPKGQELEQANAQLLTEITALTRVPGVGSQSDLETRLANLQLPTAGMYPAVRANAIKELELFLTDLDAALNNVQGGQPPSGGMPDFTNMSDADLMRIINGQ